MRHLLVLLILVSSSLSSCFLLYQQDIEQGNITTQNMVSQVRTGMTRSQVRYILGTPLVSDVFHKDRWDYYYSFQPEGRKATKKHRITILFSDNKVSHILLNDELKKQWDNNANSG
ncbi:MAG: outer membrane protein assembly factor BamE [Acidiferrobacterales bacterium]